VLILTLHSKSSHFPPSVSAFNLKMLWDDCDFFGLRFSGAFELTRVGIKGEIQHRDAKDRSEGDA
jgi:hypothetical protein